MRDAVALGAPPVVPASAVAPTMRPRHILALVLVAAVWGANFVVMKRGLQEVPPVAFVALRLGAVALVLLPFARLRRQHFLPILAISFTLGTLHFSLSFLGLKGLDAATAAISVQLQVPFAALLAAYFFNEVLGWRRLLGMAIAFAGVVIIAGEPRFDGNLWPLVTIIGAACIWSFCNVQFKWLGEEVDVPTLNAWVGLLALPQLALVSWLTEDGQIPAILGAGWEVWASVAYQALLVTTFGYAVWYTMMRRFPINQVMPFTLLVPFFGVASGVLVLGDALTVPMLLGGAATILGVAIVVIRRPRVIAPAAKAPGP
jgi:O-acetylserine/cysteine efflux transporter